AFWQIGIEETKHVRVPDGADAFLLLQALDAAVKLFHFRPMHFWTEMVLCVIAVIEEKPIIQLSVAAHAPGNWFVRVSSIMPIVAVQITEAVAKVPERQKIHDKAPVDEVNRIGWDDDRHHEQRRRECSQFDIAPQMIAVIAFSQLDAHCADIVTEGTQIQVAPPILRFGIMSMPLDPQPIHALTV